MEPENEKVPAKAGTFCLFHCFNDCLECFRVVSGQVSQNFSVQLNAGGMQFTDERRVRKTMLARSGVDPLNPETTEVPLLLAAVTE